MERGHPVVHGRPDLRAHAVDDSLGGAVIAGRTVADGVGGSVLGPSGDVLRPDGLVARYAGLASAVRSVTRRLKRAKTAGRTAAWTAAAATRRTKERNFAANMTIVYQKRGKGVRREMEVEEANK